jgi:hypothetical protein
MHAQVTTVEASPAKLDEATHHLRQHILPELQQMDGIHRPRWSTERQAAQHSPLGKRRSYATYSGSHVSHAWWHSPPPGGAVLGGENFEVSIFEVSS